MVSRGSLSLSLLFPVLHLHPLRVRGPAFPPPFPRPLLRFNDYRFADFPPALCYSFVLPLSLCMCGGF